MFIVLVETFRPEFSKRSIFSVLENLHAEMRDATIAEEINFCRRRAAL
jgi:hypothetical protein